MSGIDIDVNPGLQQDWPIVVEVVTTKPGHSVQAVSTDVTHKEGMFMNSILMENRVSSLSNGHNTEEVIVGAYLIVFKCISFPFHFYLYK